MKEVLKIRNLSKKFNGHLVINSLNATIYEGDVFGFLGPNGAGKTTTIKMILGLIRCNSGEVYINGINAIENYKEAIKNVSAIVETPKFYENLCAYDNLKIIKNFYKEIPERRIIEVLEIVNLSKHLNKKIKHFSLGMKQRLGIASALITNPKIILLDEPTNGLDPHEIIEIRQLIKSLAKEEKVTFFICSHLLHEIELLCNRVAIISNGTIVIQGKVKDLLDNSKNIYEFRVSDKEKSKAITESFCGVIFDSFTHKGIIVELLERSPWELNKEFVMNDIKVNAIHKIGKSLEEYFIETVEGSEI